MVSSVDRRCLFSKTSCGVLDVVHSISVFGRHLGSLNLGWHYDPWITFVCLPLRKVTPSKARLCAAQKLVDSYVFRPKTYRKSLRNSVKDSEIVTIPISASAAKRKGKRPGRPTNLLSITD